ncbi:hypothetical protein GGI64_006129 [Rhizobium leguminosarum]|uniref:Uncharacterized protein n=3 Tax=Rhizobium TaxID=379 RepID=A0A7W9ZQE5_RHILE|nr:MULTISPECIES: hypothetical protein [Rhizobium]EJB03617.1 hypothetical protein Rleg9DRAFT_2454 [Rhizobium leguminosarum bv. trifolii WSM597]KPH10414.1 hypothetical protein AOG23_02605 [Rhizobium acidisoli]MBB3649879.1 hypothetical protein [Rhizobium sp. BK619]MBB6220941.1 hypothetical protein [Rhizobium leguminosarum]NYJ15024.1 hypothetical protein [Rhizobium leguminosarum]
MFEAAIVLLYGLVAVAAMAVTLLEGWTNHDGLTLHRLAGLFACMLWPLTILLFILHGCVARLLTRRSRSAA